MMRRLILVPALAMLLTACPKPLPVGDVLDSAQYDVIPRGASLACLTHHEARRSAALNPAVIEWIFLHPKLPFVTGLEHPEDMSRLRVVSTEVSEKLNARFAQGYCAYIWGPGTMTGWLVDGSARLVEVVWFSVGRSQSDGGLMPRVTLLFDLNRVPGAFDPEAEIDAGDLDLAIRWTSDER